MKAKARRSLQLQHRAREQLQQGRLQDALASARDACRQEPASADAWLLQAAVHAQLQDYPQVAECCRRALRLQPGNATAAFNLGLAEQSLGRLAEARQAYQKTLELKPDYHAARINLATALLAQGEHEAALASADTVLQAAPDLPAAHVARSRVLLQTGRAEAALETLQAAQTRFGANPEIACQIALCHQALGDNERARDLLLEISRNHPGHAPAWAELGHMARRAEDYADAVHYYERAARLQPSLETRFNLAHCLYAADRVEPARRLYTELLEQAPDNPLVHNNLGRLYERIGQVDSAEKHFRRAVELQAGHAVPHCNLGRILLARKDFEAAGEAFRRAIAADAAYFEGHYGLGQALCELDQREPAIAAFRTALECKPDLHEAVYYIASLEGRDATAADHHAYVAGLFDQYADKFDHELVDRLQYRTPEYLHRDLQAALAEGFRELDILDLGCGTGLCAPLLRPHARHLAGIDLSARMIDKARDRGLYDELAVADVTAFMEQAPQSYDLILAADVFVYLGELGAAFRAAAAALRPHGWFAFSTETCDGEGYRIQGTGRHAHAKTYIRQLAGAAGFIPVSETDCQLRLDYGKPIEGTIYVLRRKD